MNDSFLYDVTLTDFKTLDIDLFGILSQEQQLKNNEVQKLVNI